MLNAQLAASAPIRGERSIHEGSSGPLDPYGLIGSTGYSLPAAEGARIVPFEAVARGAIDGISLVGGTYGPDNVVILEQGWAPTRQLRLHAVAKTSGAVVMLGREFTLQGDLRLMGVDQTVILAGGEAEVGHSGQLSAQIWGARALLYMGHQSTTNGAVCVLSGDDSRIIIGDDCMFATGIHISTYDEHAVMDMDTNRRVNFPGDVIIEPHVWLGRNTTVGKKVVLGLGSVVGAHSLATKSCPRFSVFAGSPAKVIRSRSTWDRFALGRADTVARVRDLASRVAAPILDGRD